MADEGEHVALGIVLIIIGALFLLDSLDVIGAITFSQIWPVVLIAIGAVIVYDRVRRSWRGR